MPSSHRPTETTADRQRVESGGGFAASRSTLRSMRVRSLGKSDLPVSEMGLGLAAIGRPGYINLGREQDLGPDRSVEAFRQRAHDLLDAAYAGGVRYVDAARSYGLAEEFLGSWLDHRAFPPGTSRSVPSGAIATLQTGGSAPK
jgi:hypothetical protein